MEASVVEHAHRGLLPVTVGTGACALVSGVAGVGVLGAQIAYPLLSGTALTAVTVVTVVLFATSMVCQAAAVHGPTAALRLLLVVGGVSLVAEAVGLRTGYPFGSYAYALSLGAGLADVPLVVLLAWTMMAYPSLLVARRLAATVARSTQGARGRRTRLPVTARTPVLVALLGGITLAAWDLFLDPQLVAAGFWTWHHPEPGLPGVPGVPLTNLAGWLAVGIGLTAALDRALPQAQSPLAQSLLAGSPLVPAVLLAWTWLGSTLANLAFFGRPALAGYGFVALGATVAPYLALVARDARPAPRGARVGYGPARSVG